MGRVGRAWERVPGRQADGLLQEGELWVVEAEDLVHHVGLQLHSQAEHGQGLAAARAKQDLPESGQRRVRTHTRGLRQLRAWHLSGQTGWGSP